MSSSSDYSTKEASLESHTAHSRAENQAAKDLAGITVEYFPRREEVARRSIEHRAIAQQEIYGTSVEDPGNLPPYVVDPSLYIRSHLTTVNPIDGTIMATAASGTGVSTAGLGQPSSRLQAAGGTTSTASTPVVQGAKSFVSPAIRALNGRWVLPADLPEPERQVLLECFQKVMQAEDMEEHIQVSVS